MFLMIYPTWNPVSKLLTDCKALIGDASFFGSLTPTLSGNCWYQLKHGPTKGAVFNKCNLYSVFLIWGPILHCYYISDSWYSTSLD